MTSVDIFMPIYVGDYMKKTSLLSCEEHGAYMLLLFSLWQHEGQLPNDHRKLSRACRLSEEAFSLVWASISDFFTIEDGYIKNKRITEELAKAMARKTRAKGNGLKGGRPPKEPKPKTQTKPSGLFLANLEYNLEHNLDHNLEESSSPSPSPSSSHTPTQPSKEKPPISPTGGFGVFWKAYPRRVAKPAAERSYNAAIKKADHETIIQALEAQKKSDQWTKENGKYIPHPTTWLNQERWNDKIEVKSQSAQNLEWAREIGRENGIG